MAVPGKGTLNIYINGLGEAVNTLDGMTTFADFANVNTTKYTISDNKVMWHDGNQLYYNDVAVLPSDAVVADGQYTTQSVQTIFFKHRFKNDTLIGTGTYKFRRYSVEEPVVSETWIINESFDESDKSGDVKVSFTSGGTKFGQISIGGSSTKYYGLIYCYLKSDGAWQTFFPIQNGWTVEKYGTVTFDEPVTDSKLLAWLQTNAVKQ